MKLRTNDLRTTLALLSLCAFPAVSTYAQATPQAAQANAPAAAPTPAPTPAPDTLNEDIFTVKLLSPISTVNSHQGDAFTSSVTGPERYQGGIVSGKITSVKAPQKGTGNGKPGIQFVFESLQFQGRSIPVSAVLEDVSNSKGVKNVDEEGQIIGKTSNKKRIGAAAGGMLGGMLIGAKTGGTAGMIVGGLAGGAAGYIIATEFTSAGSQIVFEPGSVFTLKVSNARQNKK